MNSNAVLSLARQLANAVLAGDQKSAAILAADLDAAWSEPQRFTPWSYGHQRNSCPEYKPGACL